MEFGPEIAIEGKRPEWVKDDTICAVCNDGEWFGLGVQIEAKEWCAWENPCSYTAIRLPADHPHYAQALAEHALEAQYKGEPLPLAVPTVTLPMMTREECLAKADEKEWSSPNTSRMAYLHAYEDLGLIAPPPAPPTDIERYIAEKGELAPYERSLAEAAIKWAQGNS